MTEIASYQFTEISLVDEFAIPEELEEIPFQSLWNVHPAECREVKI